MARFTHASGQYVPIDDASLYVEEAGDPAGPPLVLLHGGLGSLMDFNRLIDQLPAHLRFVGIDFRGHGKSTLGSAPLTYQRYQADVAVVLAHLGIRSCALLGFSDGGIVAYRMAAQTPACVASIVTIGAQWKLDVPGPVYDMLGGMTASLWTQMYPDAVDDYKAVHPAPDLERLVSAVVRLWTDPSATGYPQAEVARIQAPCLIVRGDADPLLSLDEAAALVERVDGANFFNVPFAGHDAHVDAPDLVASVVRAFLAQPRKRPAPA